MRPSKNDNRSILRAPMTEVLVRLAYFLEESQAYRRFKDFFYDLLDNPNSRMRPYFDVSMIVLVLTSIFLLIYEVKGAINGFAANFEIIAISIFIIEYLLRLWVHSHNHRIIIEHYEHAELIGVPLRLFPVFGEILRKKWQYVSSPLAIIDLLAILPSYRPLRILRVFLLFRLFKLFRYARSINEFSRVLLERRFEIYTLAIFIGFLVFAASTAIYIFEGDKTNPDIDTFFDAIYWALVTISTVGYGDITPATTEGRIVTLVLIMSGIGVIAFSTSIVVAAFTEKLGELREGRVYSELERFKDYIIICGYGRVGQVVADMLKHDGENVLIIDNKKSRVELAKQKGFLAIAGDAGESNLLQSIEARRKAAMVLCLTTDDVTNVYITLTARSMHKDVKIISRANRDETIRKLELAGADHVITPYEVVGLVASESIGQAVAFEAIYGTLTGHKYYSIDTVIFPDIAQSDIFHVQDIDFSQFKLLLLGIIAMDETAVSAGNGSYPLKKNQFVFNPKDDFCVSSGMMLVVFGHQYSIEHFRDRLAGSKFHGEKFVI